MYTHYRLKLFLVLLTFAIIVTLTITFFDNFRLKESIRTDNENHIEQSIQLTKSALSTIDKVYALLDSEIALAMEENTLTLLNKYDENPDFSSWDFTSLAEELTMDIYILDNTNTIQFSNVKEEVGLDFAACCNSLNEKLHERRNSGQLFIDEIDLDLKNNNAKKFSYQATADQKYLIELGYDLTNDAIFKHFDFVPVTKEIVANSPIIKSLTILNFGGISYGKSDEDSIPNERKDTFKKVRESKETIEVEAVYNDQEVNIKYIPFISPYEKSATSFKVIELIYEDEKINPYVETNYQQFVIQLIIIALFTFTASSLIAKWFSKPIYYAYHDSLTKLKNRAAFDDTLDGILKEDSRLFVLILLDVDNFKRVNDQLGHDVGDKLLQIMSKKLQSVTSGDVFRLGGDEFAMLIEIDKDFIIEEKVQFILRELNMVIENRPEIDELAVSVSIGIAYIESGIQKEVLYRRADRALYKAKEKGKSQYAIYEPSFETK
ncbi:MAG TPA: GGDEF domain-containing protein [Pseudogracilibacillus sp.]|nr:GGDEF domain-containing protein [Pseudogracilibacillus sp.]